METYLSAGGGDRGLFTHAVVSCGLVIFLQLLDDADVVVEHVPHAPQEGVEGPKTWERAVDCEREDTSVWEGVGEISDDRNGCRRV